jgi:hypothetical protein
MAEVSRMISRRAIRDKSAIGASPPGKRRARSHMPEGFVSERNLNSYTRDLRIRSAS